MKPINKLVLGSLFAFPCFLYPMERQAAWNAMNFGASKKVNSVDPALMQAQKELSELESLSYAGLTALTTEAEAAPHDPDIIDKVKEQNRLFTPADWLVGVYKRDLVELPVLAANITSDVLM